MLEKHNKIKFKTCTDNNYDIDILRGLMKNNSKIRTKIKTCNTIIVCFFQDFNKFEWSDGRPVGIQMWGSPYSPPQPTGQSCMFVHNGTSDFNTGSGRYSCKCLCTMEPQALKLDQVGIAVHVCLCTVLVCLSTLDLLMLILDEVGAAVNVCAQ